MKKSCIFFCIFWLFSLKISSQTITINTKNQSGNDTEFLANVKIKTTHFSASSTFDILKQKNLILSAFSFSPQNNIIFYAGNVLTSGIYSRLENPVFSKASALSESSIPAQSLNLSLPALSSSIKTPFGIGAEIYLAGASFCGFAEFQDKKDCNKFLLNMRKNIPNSDFSFSASVGMQKITPQESKSWYRKDRFFSVQRLFFATADLLFNTKKIKLFATSQISSTPFGIASGYGRIQGVFSKGISKTTAGIFLATPNHFNFSGKNLKTDFSFYFSQQLNFSFGKIFAQNLRLGFFFNADKQTTATRLKTKEYFASTGFGFSYSIGIFSVKPQFSINFDNKSKRKLFKWNDKTTICFDLAVNAKPTFWDKKQSVNFDLGYTKFPKNDKKTNQLKISGNANFTFSNLLTFSTSQSLSFNHFKKNLPTESKTIDLGLISQDFLRSNNFSLKTVNISTNFKIVIPQGKNKLTLNFKNSIKQEINTEKDAQTFYKPTIIFTIWCTLYIKP